MNMLNNLSTPELWDMPSFPEPSPEQLAKIFLNSLYRRLHVQNFSLLLCLWGGHRSGKSIGGVSLAHILDETFEKELESRIIYDAEHLAEVFHDLRKRRIRGGAIILDEGGASDFASSNWFDSIAKVANAELQSCGFLNPFLISISQYPTFLNTTIRRLSQGLWQCERKHNMYSIIRPYWISGSPWMKTSYRKFPVLSAEHDGARGCTYKICKIKMFLPPSELIKRYEDVSQGWKDKLLENSVTDIRTLNFDRTKKNVQVKNIEDIVEDVLGNYDEYCARSTKHGSPRFLSKELIRYKNKGLTDREGRLVQELVQQKYDKMKIG